MFSLARSASIVLREHPLRRLEVKTHTLEGKSHHRCISMEDIQARVLSLLYPKLVGKTQAKVIYSWFGQMVTRF